MQETWVQSLGREDPLKEMATYSRILAWEIPGTEKPGGLQSMGGVTKSWTQLSDWAHMPAEVKLELWLSMFSWGKPTTASELETNTSVLVFSISTAKGKEMGVDRISTNLLRFFPIYTGIPWVYTNIQGKTKTKAKPMVIIFIGEMFQCKVL